jgi:hypothetical protein
LSFRSAALSREESASLPGMRRNSRTMKLSYFISALIVCLASHAFGLGERATPVRDVTLYVSPDTTSAKLGTAGRGRELIILETSREFLHVEALLSEPRRDEAYEADEDDAGKTISGWILARNAVRMSTPDGDKIIYGEAVDSEDQASRSRGRKGAAQDALRLYYRVADLFPTSPLAAEAMYRSADIRWQLDKPDIMSKPSAHEQQAFLRGQIDEHWMKEVMKKFPTTKWADLAAFHLIDNKLCGDWQGASKCPVKEADIYEKYAAEHSQSPAASEALYDAAWRYAALIEIYKTEDQAKKSEDAKAKAVALAQKVASQNAQVDWAARAQRLLYLLQQNVPAYGNTE